MKHKLHFVRRLFALMLLFAIAVPSWAWSVFEENGFTFYENGGDVSLTGTSRTGSVTLPSTVTHDGIKYKVTYVSLEGHTAVTSVTINSGVEGIGTFRNCTNLTSVSIPSTVTKINDGAFSGCTSLTYISIPNSVTDFGNSVFSGCTALQTAYLPNSLTSMGYSVFSGCSALTYVRLPSNLTSLPNSTFDGCSSLGTIQIPNSVTSIAHEVFRGCTGLQTLTIPSTVTSIGQRSFEGCTGTFYYNNNVPNFSAASGSIFSGAKFSKIVFGAGVTSIGDNSFGGNEMLTSVQLPANLTYIGYRAFNNTGLTSVNIPNSVTTIGNYAFENAALESVTIGSGVTNFGEGAFRGCSNLTSAVIRSGAIGSEAFKQCANLSSLTLGSGVTSLGAAAFNECTSLTSVEIPASVTSIGGSCFQNCTGLVSASINCTSIGDGAFEGCSSLKNLTLAEGLTTLGGFKDCTSLEVVVIPASVENIGNYAFYRCTALKSVTCLSESVPTTSSWYVFGDVNLSQATLIVPSSSFEAYKTTYPWSQFGTILKIGLPTAITVVPQAQTLSVGENVALTYEVLPTDIVLPAVVWFSNNPSVATVDENGLVTAVTYGTATITVSTADGSYLSATCEVTVAPTVIASGPCGENVNYTLYSDMRLVISGTGEMADYNSYSDVPWYNYRGDITSVVIPDGVTSIGQYTFGDCSGLTSISIPNSVTSIGNYAFYNCTGLISITIPESVITIGERTFNNCRRLTLMTIPNSVTTIGGRAFNNCRGLTSVTIPESVTSIGEGAFFGCSGLTSINIPESVTSIGQYTFGSCSGLTSITIPEGVTSIGASAFYGCSGLTSITIPEGVTSIGASAFFGCSGLTSISIPNSVTSIGDYAFYNCTGLTSVHVYNSEPISINLDVFYNAHNATVYVPIGAKTAYESSGWHAFKEIVERGVQVEVSDVGTRTFCSDQDLDFSEVAGLKAYIISGFSPSTGTLTLTPVTRVPAGTGLLLYGEPGTYGVPFLETDMYYTNLLKGITEATVINPTEGEYTNFILANGSHGIGFYPVSTSDELAAGKAYLQIPTAKVPGGNSEARCFILDFDEGRATGIGFTKATTPVEDGVYYDLMGRRVEKPAKGIYILNGKKVLIK